MSDTRDFRCSTPTCRNYARVVIWRTDDSFPMKKVVCNTCAEALIATDDWLVSKRDAEKARRTRVANAFVENLDFRTNW